MSDFEDNEEYDIEEEEEFNEEADLEADADEEESEEDEFEDQLFYEQVEYEKKLQATKIPYIERSTNPTMTIYEKTKIIGQRAIEIEQGAPVYITVPEGVTTALEIARMELEQNKINYIIRRYLPNGKYEEWETRELINIISY